MEARTKVLISGSPNAVSTPRPKSLRKNSNGSPQRLKPTERESLYRSAEKRCAIPNQSFSASCKAACEAFGSGEADAVAFVGAAFEGFDALVGHAELESLVDSACSTGAMRGRGMVPVLSAGLKPCPDTEPEPNSDGGLHKMHGSFVGSAVRARD